MISTFNPELVGASLARSSCLAQDVLGFSAGSLHPGGIVEAPSSFSAPGLHANCVWESSLIGRMRQSKRIVSQAEPN